MKITRPYTILFNAILDALPLIEQGENEQAYDLLVKAQQQTEEIFIVHGDELGEHQENLASELGITKEYNCPKINVVQSTKIVQPCQFYINGVYENE